MSNEGQAPSTGGYPPQGGPSQQTPPPGSYPPPAGGAPQGGQYAPAPGQHAPQPGQYAPAPGQHAPQQGQYAQQPGQYQPGQYPQGPYQQGQYQQQPAAPRPNPFKGIPVADFVRDGVAALLLLVSLVLPVTVGRGLEGVGDRFHYIVTLVTLLSVVSLALPYLARASIFPPSWTVHTTRLVRLLANAPYVLVVLVYVVLDVVTSDEIQGVGTIFALGLAGAVLAAQPRQCELGPEDLDRGVSELWLKITLGLGAFIALTYLVSLILFLVDVGDVADFGAMYVVGHLLAWAVAVGFSLWMIYGTAVQKSPSWRLALIGVATILVCVFVFGAGEDASLTKVETMRSVLSPFVFPLSLAEGLGAIFIPAAAAAASAPATLRAMAREPREQTWIGTAVHGFDYAILVAGAAVLGAILWFTLEDGGFFASEKPTGALVTTIILGLLAVGAALYARMQLRKDPAGSRTIALGAAGALFVLGLVILILVPSDSFGSDLKYVTPGHLLLAFGLPAMIAIALTAPKEVREYFQTHRPAPRATNSAAYQWSAPPAQQAGYQYPGQPQAPAPYQGAQPQAPYQGGDQNPQTGAWQTKALPTESAPQPTAPAQAAAPTPPPAAEAAPAAHGFTAAQASDPATPMAVLADIVQNAPELRAQVAANPTAYPALVEWLGQLGDPEIDAAIRSRTS